MAFPHSLLPSYPGAPSRQRTRVRETAGFMLIEVLISAFLVALIVVASLTGFQAANRATVEERHHSQAAQLAAEAQEKLRSDPASVLDNLYGEPRIYTEALGGTTYTIEQRVEPLNSNGSVTGCSATEASSQSGSNVSIETHVTWPTSDSSRKTPGVRQRGVITPPVGSDLEVDVLNGQEPEAGVGNVDTLISYPLPSPTSTLEATTGSGGCTVFTGLGTTTTRVDVPEKLGYVTPSGALKYSREVQVAPNITTHAQVVFNEGGQIKGEFTYKGATTYKGVTVTGETFAAFNNRINSEPNFIVGSASATNFEYESAGERKYKALTGSAHSGTSALTPAASSYPKGDLFPFPSAWAVAAGDCKANNVTAEDQPSPAPVVHPGQTTSVRIPTSYLKVNLWKGTKSKQETLDTTSSLPVMITDTACSSEPTPDDAFAANIKHPQETKQAHLELPFQPFGKGQLCIKVPVASKSNLSKHWVFNYALANANGATLNVYEGEVAAKKIERKEEVINETEPKEKPVIEEVIEELESSSATCK